jgi:hypothetical protein
MENGCLGYINHVRHAYYHKESRLKRNSSHAIEGFACLVRSLVFALLFVGLVLRHLVLFKLLDAL